MHNSKKNCNFASKIAKVRKKMKTNTYINEAPIQEISSIGDRQEYLTADELMSRLEPHIRSLFR